MLNVSLEAAEALIQGLAQKDLEPGESFRLTFDGAKFNIVPDAIKVSDKVVEHNSIPVLLIGPEVELALPNATLDIEQRPGGAHVVLRPD
tara:strand:- start:127 stop:396 length:270 start_codon:yes stop_codon:yes gene_type:complete